MDAEVFTVRDAAADRFLTPFFSDTVETALRQFKEACLSPEHQFHRFPEDYVLYHIGTFRGETGEIEAWDPHKLLNATSVLSTKTEVV